MCGACHSAGRAKLNKQKALSAAAAPSGGTTKVLEAATTACSRTRSTEKEQNSYAPNV